MPKSKWGVLERKLWKQARKNFPKDKNRQRRYVYGTLRKVGWRSTSARSKR